MTATQPILFASSSLEESQGPVRAAIEERGYEVIVFAIDRVMVGMDQFAISVIDGLPFATYQGVDISPGSIGSAWFWKPLSFRAAGAEDNVAKQLSLLNELTSMSNSLWGLYPEHLWLNAPGATWLANRKLPQLALAQQVGFDVPPTLLCNRWDDVDRCFFEMGTTEIIAKMHRGVIADHNTVKAMYTTRLTAASVSALTGHASPFPGLIQPYVSKQREWRVTVVRDDVFPIAIYTSGLASDDWRRLQIDPDHVDFRSEDLPEGVAERCVNYLALSSLQYGAFDLIEAPDGRVVFLECNPSGQFMWLIDSLGDRIVNALADALISIAAEGRRE